MRVLFYQLSEVAKRLRKTEDEIKELVENGKLREFRENYTQLFKVNEVDALTVDSLQLYIAEIEKKLRVEIERRASAVAMSEVEAQKRFNAEQGAEAEQAAKAKALENVRAYEKALAIAQEDVKAQAEARVKTEEEISSYKKKIAEIGAKIDGAIADQKKQLEARAEIEKKLRDQIEENKKLQDQIRIMTEIAESAKETGICECCDKKRVPKDQLVAIDSGHLFCPDCLEAFKQSVQAIT